MTDGAGGTPGKGVQPPAAKGFPNPADILDVPVSHAPPIKTDRPTAIPAQRVWMFKLTRFSPIRQLDPETLGQQMDWWYAGNLRPFALLMEAVERRDDVLASVVPKRKGAVARRKLEVMLDEDADPEEAERHASVLRYFYKHATASSAIDQNERGKLSLLLTQMMDAQMKRYAAHEIQWIPTGEMVEITVPDGTGGRKSVGQSPGLTANFNFVPSWFFENRTGKLRFLQQDFAFDGVDLDEGAWMVTVGLGIMEAATVAYMFKKLGMQDWLLYSQKHGMPGVHGKTNFPPESVGFNALVDAVRAIAADFSCVTNKDDEIEKISLSAEGTLPYPPLVERMDRAMAALMRGADLSSMSAHHTAGAGGQGGGQGASLQGEESHIVEADDATKLSETLQMNIDAKVIEYHFGAGVKPLARAVIVIPPEQDATKDLTVVQGLVGLGCKIGQNETLRKFGWERMSGEDEPLVAPVAPPKPGMGGPGGMGPDEEDFSNEAAARSLVQNSEALFRSSTYAALKPLVDRVLGVMELPDNATEYGMQKLHDDMPGIVAEIMADPEAARVLRDAMSAAWFNGVVTSAVESHIAKADVAAR